MTFKTNPVKLETRVVPYGAVIDDDSHEWCMTLHWTARQDGKTSCCLVHVVCDGEVNVYGPRLVASNQEELVSAFTTFARTAWICFNRGKWSLSFASPVVAVAQAVREAGFPTGKLKSPKEKVMNRYVIISVPEDVEMSAFVVGPFPTREAADEYLTNLDQECPESEGYLVLEMRDPAEYKEYCETEVVNYDEWIDIRRGK